MLLCQLTAANPAFRSTPVLVDIHTSQVLYAPWAFIGSQGVPFWAS